MTQESDRLIFNQIFGDKPTHAEDLPPGNELKDLAEQIVPKFDACVDYIREKFPNEHINTLMTLFWRLVGNKITPTALTPIVPGISFWAEANSTQAVAYVLIPTNWLTLLDQDLYMQLGALVSTASQAKDFTEFITSPTNSPANSRVWRNHALAYEAEYLITLIQLDEQFEPNEYQQKVINLFPRGIAE